MPKRSKRKNQLVDARASKHVKMAEPEMAFDHAAETEAIHSFAQEWMQVLYTKTHTHTHTVLNYTFTKMRKTIPEAKDSINLGLYKYFRKAKNYMFGYLEGNKEGSNIY